MTLISPWVSSSRQPSCRYSGKPGQFGIALSGRRTVCPARGSAHSSKTTKRNAERVEDPASIRTSAQ